MSLTRDEARYMGAEQGITIASERIARFSRQLARGNNLDLFMPDSDLTYWRGIRAACVAETERLEAKYAIAEQAAAQVVMTAEQRRWWSGV